jgi:hypothetical protein
MAEFTAVRRFTKKAGREHTTGTNAAGNSFDSWRTLHQPVEARLSLEIDVDELMRVLGHRAVNSKGGKAVLQGGLIKVRLLEEKALGDPR